MRTASAVHWIIASFLMIPVAGMASLSDDAPINFRLSRLGSLLSQLNASEPVGQYLWVRGVTFKLSWNQPADAFDPVDEDLPAAKIVEIAIGALKDKLPEEIRPETSNLLGVAKYQISHRQDKPPKWVWVAEFRIDDETPMGGAGYAQTLFVPVSMKGTVLLTVRKN